MRRAIQLAVGVALGLFVLGGLASGVASAGAPENPECWGVVTGQLASSDPGAMGDHASQQEEPRFGLGNVTRELGFDHISELGTFLAAIDGIEATECPSS